ncbi:MAG: SAVED domain-containing protein [Gemmatales bacterium]|nr:SAVED domain-containing protein [Gemmatales bacterium]MDW7994431.1 SAVED domain-containing protein [Gemmatales bacterium]
MWDWLHWLGRSLVGGGMSALGAFIVGSVLSYAFQEYRIRKMRQKLAQMSQERKSEAVLIVSNREDISPAVVKYLKETHSGELPIYHVCRIEPFSDEQKDWNAFLERVKQEIRKLRQESSPSRILLFTNVPVAMGVLLGAMLDNGPEVVVHHYFNGVYRPIGYLVQEAVKIA